MFDPSVSAIFFLTSVFDLHSVNSRCYNNEKPLLLIRSLTTV